MAYIANDFDGIREAMRERGLLDEDKEKLRQAQERASAIDRELLDIKTRPSSQETQEYLDALNSVFGPYRRNGVVYPVQAGKTVDAIEEIVRGMNDYELHKAWERNRDYDSPERDIVHKEAQRRGHLPPDEPVSSLRGRLLEFGFQEWNTGGGCTCLGATFKNGSALCVTDGNGMAPDSFAERAYAYHEDSNGDYIADYGGADGYTVDQLLNLARNLAFSEV